MYILMHENHKFHKHPLHIRKSSNGKKLASGNLVLCAPKSESGVCKMRFKRDVTSRLQRSAKRLVRGCEKFLLAHA